MTEEIDLTKPNPLVRLQVNIFFISENESSHEIAEKIKGSKAVILVGKVDENHIETYKKAIEEAGINPLLVRIVDPSWGEKEIEYNKVILTNSWTADLAIEEEKSESVSRRDLILGKVKIIKKKVDKPIYINDYCKWLYRACNVCEQSCPYNAITVDKKSGVIINYDKCKACGLCVASCPVSALQFPSISQQSIFELAKIKGDKKITCYRNEKSNGVKLPCLAMLSEVDILLLRSNGKVQFECPGCELQSNLNNFIQLITDYNNKIGGINFISPNLKIEEKEVKELKISSENYFNRAEARKKIMEKENLPYIQFDVSIHNNSCTLCESCVKWCPTSAIKLVRDNEEERITFNPTSCIGCNICMNVCPESCGKGEKVIKVSKSKEAINEEKIIFKDELVRCRVCGTPIGSRRSLNHVKKIMEERGAIVDDEWLERCPKHRAEYAFQMRFGFQAKFKPKKGVG